MFCSKVSHWIFLSNADPRTAKSPDVEHSGFKAGGGRQITDLCLRAMNFSEPAPQGGNAEPA